MGVRTYEHEITTTIPPARLFKAFLDADNLFPKLAPQAVKHVEILEGNGGPGTIKKVTYEEGSESKYVKHQVDSIDCENLTYKHSLIEGDVLVGKIRKISYETKLVASRNGGSIVKATSTYYSDNDEDLIKVLVKEGKEKASALFKLVEGYLNANPNDYN